MTAHATLPTGYPLYARKIPTLCCVPVYNRVKMWTCGQHSKIQHIAFAARITHRRVAYKCGHRNIRAVIEVSVVNL